MTYYNFAKKISKYLKSVRMLEDYISFDMLFSTTWTIPKDNPNNIEIIKNKTNEKDKVLLSFVSKINKESIDNIENSIDEIIKYNLEREEKESLFKLKVNELKKIFQEQKLDNLKDLDFNFFIQNNDLKIKDEGPADNQGNREITFVEETESTKN